MQLSKQIAFNKLDSSISMASDIFELSINLGTPVNKLTCSIKKKRVLIGYGSVGPVSRHPEHFTEIL